MISGADFHVPIQNFGAQSGGQMAGIGAAVGIQTQRGPLAGNIQSIVQSTSGLAPGVPSGGQSQTTQVSNLQLQTSAGSSATASSVHNPSTQEMNKQVHTQTSPSSVQQVYVPNPNRSGSQVNVL